jgi:hypothetical protein
MNFYLIHSLHFYSGRDKLGTEAKKEKAKTD